MNGFLWAAVVFAVLGAAGGVSAWKKASRAISVDDYEGILGSVVVLAVCEFIAIVLGVTGWIVG